MEGQRKEDDKTHRLQRADQFTYCDKFIWNLWRNYSVSCSGYILVRLINAVCVFA